ncbi:hypothetical protein CHH64_08515 [Terribacillus saccharophilus]|uniref:Uncharacterized protein n=1 Tax=Terribacillus saccharophilus TaxID=361277 RepID=A0A268ABM3_9BACI|nr:hypothetical protein CHH64_08515 [Terribacillus saccharophilus]
MFNTIRYISMKTAILLGICFYTLTILIHVLVISGILPYTWVNGGRADSFATQFQLSIISIIICIIGGLFTFFAAENRVGRFNRGITIICWFLVMLCSIGLIQQLLGTSFEKGVCSFIVLLGIISNLRLAVETRKQ